MINKKRKRLCKKIMQKMFWFIIYLIIKEEEKIDKFLSLIINEFIEEENIDLVSELMDKSAQNDIKTT
jgi:hypothetical protein